MSSITAAPFGRTREGIPVMCYTMRSAAGMRVDVLDYGCTVRRIVVPDRAGRATDVALGYDDIAGCEAGSCFLGSFVGRYANRIRGASFPLGGRVYELEKNDGENHLHGVYSRRVFDAAIEDGALVFRRVSPAGEEGFPGTLTLRLTYRLTDENALLLEYRAKTDADTVVNLTNHTYFNLSGCPERGVLDHVLTLSASRFTETDAHTLPTGRVLPVDGTALDFRAGRTIGAALRSGDPQLALCRGLDHNLILDGGAPAGSLYCAETGIELVLSTTQPAVQVYSGNYLDEDAAPCGRGGVRYPRHGGLCLETQRYPCAPNFPHFPSALLRPGEEYHHTTEYRFGIR